MNEKQPSEFELVGVDMTDVLQSGETLAANNANGALSVGGIFNLTEICLLAKGWRDRSSLAKSISLTVLA